MATCLEIASASLRVIAFPGDAPEPVKRPDHALHADYRGQRFDRGIIPVEIVNMNYVRRIVLNFRETSIRPLEHRKQLFDYVVQAGVVEPAKETRIHHLSS